jgi:hypothetical protein
MHTYQLRAALAAIIVFLPIRSEAQVSATVHRAATTRAEVVISSLLAHRQELALSTAQVDSLTALADRSREDHGHLQIVGLDRVPGKSVPRFVRVYPVRERAGAMALRLLSPRQRQDAASILREGRRVNTARR